MASQQAYQKKLEAQLDDLDVKIGQLNAHVKLVPEDERFQFEKSLDELKNHRERTYKLLAQFEAFGGDSWDEVKNETEKSCAEIVRELQIFTSHFQ